MKSDISERELDMLLNRRLEAKTHMDQDDFVKIFKDPIRRAQELRNEEATQQFNQTSILNKSMGFDPNNRDNR